MLSGNIMINGKTINGLKLVEGIREFDLVMISSSEMTGLNMNVLLKSLSQNVRFIVKVDKSCTSIWKDMMKLWGFNEEASYQEEGDTFISLKRGKIEAEQNSKILLSYIKSAKSILNINLHLEDTVKKILLCNYNDQYKRTFVIMQETVNENMFESIRKQGFIYETKFERIVLDDSKEEVTI